MRRDITGLGERAAHLLLEGVRTGGGGAGLQAGTGHLVIRRSTGRPA